MATDEEEFDYELAIMKAGTGGGFKIQDSTGEILTACDWEETTTILYNDKAMAFNLEDLDCEMIKFKAKEDYEQFKKIQKDIKPESIPYDPFSQFQSIVARQSVARTATQIQKDIELNKQDFMMFDILKEKKLFFGPSWK